MGAPAAVTPIAFEVPIREALTMSVAEIDWLPAVSSVAEKLPMPFGSVASAGRMALLSVLVKWMVPE